MVLFRMPTKSSLCRRKFSSDTQSALWSHVIISDSTSMGLVNSVCGSRIDVPREKQRGRQRVTVLRRVTECLLPFHTLESLEAENKTQFRSRWQARRCSDATGKDYLAPSPPRADAKRVFCTSFICTHLPYNYYNSTTTHPNGSQLQWANRGYK